MPSKRKTGAKRSVRKTTIRKKRAKQLPMKKWLQAIKDSKTGGQDVEDKKGKSPRRRGDL